MNAYDHFVLPFTLGLYTLLIIFIVRVWEWIRRMPHEERMVILRGIFSRKIFGVIGEIFMESLLHRRIFKVNPLLGYMHMSLAFGWFLLIVVGAIESRYLMAGSGTPWEAIFVKYFVYDTIPLFNHLMDALLLVVLSGVALALFKRFRSRLLGLKRATRQKTFDKFAITALWLIFPLRLLAESTTAGLYLNGGFLTNSLGRLLMLSPRLQYAEYTLWWAYSLSLGVFFVALPFSRYMHIPTEIILIALRRFGFRTNKEITSFTEIEVYSCSRCGICIDRCQLVTSLGRNDIPPVYFLTSIRRNRVKADRSFDCLSCGRCSDVCPVQINLTGIRELQRERFVSNSTNFSYLAGRTLRQNAKVGYYAGCMTHLTPSVKKSMIRLLRASGSDYVFLDEDGTACCGRPMMLTGNYEAARELMEVNRRSFIESGIEMLVTSCAICYKVFKEDYHLGIPVLHHSEFLLQAVEGGQLKVGVSDINAVYHDPCDLGRGSNVYDAPRELLSRMLSRMQPEQERNGALCCGGSLSNIMVTQHDRDKICRDALQVLEAPGPEVLVTACPLCKKTFARNTATPVRDIAEMVEMCLDPTP